MRVVAGGCDAAGKAVMTEWGDTGPLRPVHIREAFRRISSTPASTCAAESLLAIHKAQTF